MTINDVYEPFPIDSEPLERLFKAIFEKGEPVTYHRQMPTRHTVDGDGRAIAAFDMRFFGSGDVFTINLNPADFVSAEAMREHVNAEYEKAVQERDDDHE